MPVKCADIRNQKSDIRRRNAGFTLYEVVIVLIVLLTVSAIVVPSFSGFLPSVRVRKAGDGLLSTIAKAHDDSVLTSRRFRIVFTKEPPAYRLEFEPDPMNEPATFVPMPGEWGAKSELPDDVAYAIEGAQTDDETEEEYLEFSPDGSGPEAAIVFSHENGDQVRIEINPADGRARVVEDEEETP